MRRNNTVCFNKYGETREEKEVLLLNTHELSPYIPI